MILKLRPHPFEGIVLIIACIVNKSALQDGVISSIDLVGFYKPPVHITSIKGIF